MYPRFVITMFLVLFLAVFFVSPAVASEAGDKALAAADKANQAAEEASLAAKKVREAVTLEEAEKALKAAAEAANKAELAAREALKAAEEARAAGELEAAAKAERAANKAREAAISIERTIKETAKRRGWPKNLIEEIYPIFIFPTISQQEWYQEEKREEKTASPSQ